MSIANKALLAAALAATTLTSACVTDPVTGERRVSRAAIGAGAGVVGGYLLGDLVGGRNDRTEKIVGAAGRGGGSRSAQVRVLAGVAVAVLAGRSVLVALDEHQRILMHPASLAGRVELLWCPLRGRADRCQHDVVVVQVSAGIPERLHRVSDDAQAAAVATLLPHLTNDPHREPVRPQHGQRST